MTDTADTLRDIVIANRILAHEEVVDAFGHISIRNPANPEQYLLSRARAPPNSSKPKTSSRSPRPVKVSISATAVPIANA